MGLYIWGSGKNSGFWVWGGLWGGEGGHFILNLNEKVAQKLCRTILPHIGLVTFIFHLIFMMFGPSGLDHDPQNPLLLNFESV